MDEIKITATCKNLDGSKDLSEVTMSNSGEVTFENSEEPGEGGGGAEKISYESLKQLRDEGKLVPGRQYRITDYQCTTIQEETYSADHQFDIIVQALDEKTLSENAKACRSENDETLYSFYLESENETYRRDPSNDGDFAGKRYYAYENGGYFIYSRSLYDAPTDTNLVVFSGIGDDNSGVPISQGYEYETISDKKGSQPITQYRMGYFSTSNLAAWELRYTIDNDPKKFVWADYAKAIKVKTLDAAEDTIIFVRYPQGDTDGLVAWAYHFDGENVDFKDIIDWSNFNSNDLIFTDSADPEIGSVLDYHGTSAKLIALKQEGKGVIYYMKDEYDNECPYDFKNMLFKYTDDTFGMTNCYTFSYFYNESGGAIVDASIYGNDGTLLNDENSTSGVRYNVIRQYADYGIGVGFYESYRAQLNKIIFLSKQSSGREFYGVRSNSFGNCCYNIVLLSDCCFNHFGEWCNNISLGDSCQDDDFGQSCDNISLGRGNSIVSIGKRCSQIQLKDDCFEISIGDDCSYIDIMPQKGYYSSLKIDSSCENLKLDDDHGDGSTIRNVHIHRGVRGPSSLNQLTISVAPNLSYETDVQVTGSTTKYVN